MTLTLEHYKERDHLNTEIKAEIVADSMTLSGLKANRRLTTFLVTMPISALGHIVRHRVFSLSVASNRALSTQKILETLIYQPDWRYRADRGMQPGEFAPDYKAATYNQIWNDAREHAIDSAEILANEDIAKELVNRIISPYQMIDVLITASTFENFFTLRDHPDTQQDTQIVARRMKEAYDNNSPRFLYKGMWHLPFIREEDMLENTLAECMAVSVARCARTSYKLPNSKTYSSFDSDIELFKRLLAPPIHASPFEHVSTPLSVYSIYNQIFPDDITSKWYGNTEGWVQLRKFYEYADTDVPVGLTHFLSIINELKSKVI